MLKALSLRTRLSSIGSLTLVTMAVAWIGIDCAARPACSQQPSPFFTIDKGPGSEQRDVANPSISRLSNHGATLPSDRANLHITRLPEYYASPPSADPVRDLVASSPSDRFHAYATLDLGRHPSAFLNEVTLFGVLSEQWGGIRSDYAEFYSPAGLAYITCGMAAGAIMANSPFDEHFRDSYKQRVVGSPPGALHNALHQPKIFGEGMYTIPTFIALALAEPWIDDLPLGSEASEWGQRSIRTILVGGPAVIGLQLLTGASRPGESSASSKWKPLQDNNGVSGHSFMGAVPFLSAAKMTDNILLKSGLYTASVLPGLSRLNDDEHYFSQVVLGWWVAYIAASAVDHSHNPHSPHQWHVYPSSDGLGFAYTYTM